MISKDSMMAMMISFWMMKQLIWYKQLKQLIAARYTVDEKAVNPSTNVILDRIQYLA